MDLGDNRPIVASFEIDSQCRTSRLFQYVCLRSIDKARMVGGAMAGDGMAGNIVAPDNQYPTLSSCTLYGPIHSPDFDGWLW